MSHQSDDTTPRSVRPVPSERYDQAEASGLPPARRGFFSGLLQEGYPIGYLMAALAYLMITALHANWRWIFVLSIIPALTTLLLRRRVTESEAWQATRRNMGATRTTIRDILRDGTVVKRFGYLIVLIPASPAAPTSPAAPASAAMPPRLLSGRPGLPGGSGTPQGPRSTG